MNPQNNYDFILNPSAAPKRSLSLGGGGAPTKRLLVIAGAGIGFIILIFIVVSLFKGGSSALTSLTGIAQTQSELVRVATEGGARVAQDSNQSMAIDVQLTIGSQQQALIAFLAKYNTKLEPKTLALKKNTNTDAQLTTAQQNSTYDVVFAQIMQNELTEYLHELQTAYNASSSAKTKALLSTDFSQAAVLLKQIPSSASLSGS